MDKIRISTIEAGENFYFIEGNDEEKNKLEVFLSVEIPDLLKISKIIDDILSKESHFLQTINIAGGSLKIMVLPKRNIYTITLYGNGIESKNKLNKDEMVSLHQTMKNIIATSQENCGSKMQLIYGSFQEGKENDTFWIEIDNPSDGVRVQLNKDELYELKNALHVQQIIVNNDCRIIDLPYGSIRIAVDYKKEKKYVIEIKLLSSVGKLPSRSVGIVVNPNEYDIICKRIKTLYENDALWPTINFINQWCNKNNEIKNHDIIIDKNSISIFIINDQINLKKTADELNQDVKINFPNIQTETLQMTEKLFTIATKELKWG